MALNNLRKKMFKKNYLIIVEICKISGLSFTELMMTSLGYKPAMVNAIFLDSELKKNIGKIRSYARKIGLHLAVSYKYITERETIEEISLDESHSGRIIFALSKSKEKANKAADYFYKKMFGHAYGHKFGKLMGYPECCLKFGDYLNNDKCNPDNFGFKNPGIESLKRSKDFDWHLNIFTTPPISHFPCSLTCKKSIEYVEKMLESLDYIGKRDYLTFKDHLTRPASLYWTWADRILLYGDFKQYALGTGEIKYNKIEPMIISGTFYQELGKKVLSQWKNMEKYLRQGNKLIVTDDSCNIYQDKKKIFEVNKNNKYIPVLVKPNISI